MKTNVDKVITRSISKKDFNQPNNVLARSNSISRIFSQNKTVLNYLGKRLKSNDHLQQENISTSPYSFNSLSRKEQKSQYSFNKYTKAKIITKKIPRTPSSLMNQRNIFFESRQTPSNQLNRVSSLEEVNFLKIQNHKLKKEIKGYKALLQQISDKNKRTIINGINSLSSHDNFNE